MSNQNSKSINYVKLVVIVAIGAALYGGLGYFGIPVFANTTLKPAMAILGIFAAMFGPVVGFIVGFIGHWLTDTISGWGVWFSWVLGSGLVGAIIGVYPYITKKSLEKGVFGGKEIGIFIILSFVANFLGYMVSAIIDCVMYAEPVSKVIVQQLIAAFSNTVMIGTIGTALMILVAKRNANNQNLKLED